MQPIYLILCPTTACVPDTSPNDPVLTANWREDLDIANPICMLPQTATYHEAVTQHRTHIAPMCLQQERPPHLLYSAPVPSYGCRYMVLFHQGGVHADADTLCVLPAPAWAPRGCQFAAAAAGPDSFEPSAIASVAGHAVLHTVLELMVERMQALEELMRAGADLEDLAYNTTGPGVFTDGIAMHVGLEQVEGQPADVSALLAHQAELRRAGVCLLTADEMQDCIVKVDASWDDSGALLAINA